MELEMHNIMRWVEHRVQNTDVRQEAEGRGRKGFGSRNSRTPVNPGAGEAKIARRGVNG
jgi:hypothetical protein